MKFYIFRHGETFASKTFTPYEGDNFNTPILYEGKDTTIKLANYLKDVPSDLNVSSPYERCRETVKIITEITGKEFIFDDRVGEYFQIEYEKYKGRIVNFLEEVKQKSYQDIVICTHGATMSMLVHLLCDDSPEEKIPVSEFKQTGVLVIIENKTIKEVDFNS